ncbi:MAG: hypothetical protein ACK41T_01485 [Pseudobdellovibrio sp.]
MKKNNILFFIMPIFIYLPAFSSQCLDFFKLPKDKNLKNILITKSSSASEKHLASRNTYQRFYLETVKLVQDNRIAFTDFRVMTKNLVKDLSNSKLHTNEYLVNIWADHLSARLLMTKKENKDPILPGLSEIMSYKDNIAMFFIKNIANDPVSSWYNFIANEVTPMDYFNEGLLRANELNSFKFKMKSDLANRPNDVESYYFYNIQREIIRRISKNPEDFYTSLGLNNPLKDHNYLPLDNNVTEMYRNMGLNPPEAKKVSDSFKFRIKQLKERIFFLN